jgi:hypothetical protein
MGEIEAGEVKVESRLTVETQKISEPPLDSTTINLIMFYHILVYKLHGADVSMKKTSRYFVSRTRSNSLSFCVGLGMSKKPKVSV